MVRFLALKLFMEELSLGRHLGGKRCFGLRLWRALRKPTVGPVQFHECFFDLCHTLQSFIGLLTDLFHPILHLGYNFFDSESQRAGQTKLEVLWRLSFGIGFNYVVLLEELLKEENDVLRVDLRHPRLNFPDNVQFIVLHSSRVKRVDPILTKEPLDEDLFELIQVFPVVPALLSSDVGVFKLLDDAVLLLHDQQELVEDGLVAFAF